jgi:hypothetical protein
MGIKYWLFYGALSGGERADEDVLMAVGSV